MPAVFRVLAFYCIVALLLTFPLLTALGSAVSDPVDPILNSWIMAWEHHILLTDPLELLNANIFYPYEQTLLYSETLLLPSLLLLPLSVATGNPILVHNLLLLMGFAVTGVSGYLLGRWLFRSHWAGLVLGTVLAFNSYTLSNIGQTQLLHLEWLPLALLYLGKLFERPRLRFGLLLAFFLAAQFYTVVYYGLFGFVIVGVVGGVGWLLRSFPTSQVRWRALAFFIGSKALAILLCLPLGLAYYKLSIERGFARTLDDVWPFSASLEMWITTSPRNLLYGWLLGDPLPTLGYYPLDALFPGLFLLLMAASGLLLWFWHASGIGSSARNGGSERTVRYPVFVLLGIAFFFLLSLGPYLQIESLQPHVEWRLPYAWIHEWMPGFQALRAPGRFAAMVFLGLGLASAYLITHLRWRFLPGIAFALLLVEVLLLPVDALYVPAISPDQQAAYEWLASQPETVYLELPIERFGEGEPAHWLESQYGSTMHWQRTLVGYSGFFPNRHDDLLRFVSRFPDAEVVNFLQAVGVEWVLIHRERVSPPDWNAIQFALREQGWETQQWGNVWSIRLPAIEVQSPKAHFFIPDRAQMGNAVSVGVIFTSDQPTPVLLDSAVGQIRAEWWREEELVLTHQRRHQPPFVVDTVAVTTLSIPVPDVEGVYTLQLHPLDYTQADHSIAVAEVSVIADVAAPEAMPLSVAGVGATILCVDDGVVIDVLMRTVGWYDAPFTLSARLLNGHDAEIARSAADVEFPAEWQRKDLLTSHAYTLPLAEVPDLELGSLIVELVAYQWQQEAERTVSRLFVTEDGDVVPTLRLPVTTSPACQ